MVVKMAPGNEKEDLRWLVRHVSTRGCDIKIWSSKEDGSESFLTPYPGFMWLWKTLLSYKWHCEQHINVLEVSAFLVELRRRTSKVHWFQIHQCDGQPGHISRPHKRTIVKPQTQSFSQEDFSYIVDGTNICLSCLNNFKVEFR